MKRFTIKLLCKLIRLIEEIIMKLLPQFCQGTDSDVHLPSICEHMDKFIGADDVTIIQGTPFDPTEGVTAVDEYGREVPWTVSPSELEDPCEVGQFTFRYMTEHFVDDRIVTVIQASAPTFEGLTNITVGLDESFGTLVGVTATDAHGNAVAVTCLEGSSYIATEVGEQILHYTATDACGNVGTAERVITVEAGHFEGIADASVNQGLGFDLRQGVTAHTYSGTQTSFSVDPDAIDACELGEQTVTYTAMGILPTERTITVLPIANPTISGVSEPIEVEPNEEFDPLDGVTATDGNGFDITADVTVREMNYRTVLYNDGTFIINEKETDYETNATLHGGVKKTYIPFDPNGSDNTSKYIFGDFRTPWHNECTYVKAVRFGSNVKPTSTAWWFYNFYICTSFDFSGLDTSAVTNMDGTFFQVQALTSLDVSSLDTRSVTSMKQVFYNSIRLTSLDVSTWDTRNVVDMSSMFQDLSAITSLDLSNFDTSSVTNMGWMFTNCYNLAQIYASDSFVTGQVTDGARMFGACYRLTGGAGTVYDSSHEDYTYARIDNPPDAPGYFTQKPSA